MAVPLMPPGVSLLENMATAKCKGTHLQSSIMVLQARCWAFPSMFCYGQQVSLKRSQKPPSRNLAHGGAVTLLAMILEINIG